MASYPEVGAKFGRLTVSGAGFRKGSDYRVPVHCTCGVLKDVNLYNLLHGNTTSCGCFHREELSARKSTHRLSGTSIYMRWASMVGRCCNPEHSSWPKYGARGITVSRRWLTFEKFYADMGEPPFIGATIERKNGSKGYSKTNCVWASYKEQACNRASNVHVVYRGKKYTVSQLAEKIGMRYGLLYSRLFTYKWSLERAVNTP